jgi:hypothetical protein
VPSWKIFNACAWTYFHIPLNIKGLLVSCVFCPLFFIRSGKWFEIRFVRKKNPEPRYALQHQPTFKHLLNTHIKVSNPHISSLRSPYEYIGRYLSRHAIS